MGWRGTLRSVVAASRAAEKNRQRRERQFLRNQKETFRQTALQLAANEVEEYTDACERLTALHTEEIQPINWKLLATAMPPKQPINDGSREFKARKLRDTYQPGFFTRLLRLSDYFKNKLNAKVISSNKEDLKQYKAEVAKYSENLEKWETTSSFAKRMINGEPEAYLKTWHSIDSLKEFSDLILNIEISVVNSSQAVVNFLVAGESVVPKDIKTLRKNGLLSEKPMPKSGFYRLYRNYICSSFLKVSHDLLCVLPVDTIFVNVLDHIVDKSTGHLRNQVILSVIVHRETFASINLEKVDPAESLKNFLHEIDFHQNVGFHPVAAIGISRLSK